MFERFHLPADHMMIIDDVEKFFNFEKLFRMIARRRKAQIYLKVLRFVILFFLLACVSFVLIWVS